MYAMQISITNPAATIDNVLSETGNKWAALVNDYPLFGSLFDEIQGDPELRRQLIFGDVTEKEYLWRIRGSILLLIETVGMRNAEYLLTSHSYTAIMAVVSTIEKTMQTQQTMQPFAFPCLVYLLCLLSLELSPSDVKSGFEKAMETLDLNEEEQEFIFKQYEVVQPTIH